MVVVVVVVVVGIAVTVVVDVVVGLAVTVIVDDVVVVVDDNLEPFIICSIARAKGSNADEVSVALTVTLRPQKWPVYPF